MRTVLAIVIGSDTMTVATYSSDRPSMRSMSESTALTVIPVGDDPRMVPFSDRVGDPVPVVTDDGLARTGARFAAEAISVLSTDQRHMTRGVTGYDDIVVVHPSTWSRYAVAALVEEMRIAHVVSNAGVPLVVSRAHAADAWLRTTGRIEPERPGFVVDVDEDATVVSLSRSIDGRTAVVTEPGSDPFGAAMADRILLQHIVEQIRKDAPAFDPDDPANWVSIRDLAERCARARTLLSSSTSTVVDVRIPGIRKQIRVVRSEYDELLDAAVTGVAMRVAGTVAQLGTRPDSVVLHGKAASIPIVSTTLSAVARVPVMVAAEPESVTAKGAVSLGVERAFRFRPAPPRVPMEVRKAPSRPFWTRGKAIVVSAAAAVLLVGGGVAAAEALQPAPAVHTSVVPASEMTGLHTGATGR